MRPASTTSRFQAPSLVAPCLRRSRLMKRLVEALESPVSFIEAGAGYGKTSLLADFGGAAGRKVAWYCPSRRDRQQGTLLGHLAQAVRVAFPGWPVPSNENCGPGQESFNFFAAELSRLPEPLLLVVDGFHVVGDLKWVQEAVDCLLGRHAAGVHLALLSRHAPPAYIARRAARLGQADLAFTPEEARQVLALLGGATPAAEVLGRIMEETRGWPYGVVAMGRDLEDTREGREVVFRYLEQEAFLRSSRRARELLVKTSFLPVVEPCLADALLSRRDSETLLGELARTHSFVEPEGSPCRYRCHPLFRQFLAARLAGTAGEARELRVKAAEILAGNGEIDAAFRVYVDMADWTSASGLLAERAYGLVRSGRGTLVAEMAAALPADLVTADPKLLLVKSKLAEVGGRYEEARALAQRAEAVAQKIGHRVAQGHATATLGALRRLQGDFRGARPLLEEGLSKVPEPETAWYRLNLAAIYLAADRYDLAESICRPIIEDPTAYDDRSAEGEALHIVGMTYFFYSGRPAAGLDMLLQALEAKEKAGVGQSASLTMAVLGLCYLVQGDFQQALARAERALALAHRSAYLRAEALAQGVAGWALVELDRPAVAEGLLVKAAATLSEMADYWLIAAVQPGLALQREVAGDYAGALGACQDGLAAARSMGTCFHIAWSLLMQAGLHHRWGEAHRAEVLLEEAESLLKTCSSILAEASIHLRRALIYRERGEAARASEHLAQALGLARQVGYTFFVGARPWEVSSLLSWAAGGIGEPARSAREFLATGKKAPEPLSIRTLGGFEVRRGLDPLTPARWRRPGVERLFKYLVVHRGRWVSREQITEALWPHLPPAAAANNLRSALSSLRQALEPGPPIGHRLIVGARGLLKLALPQDCFLDLDEMEEAASRARSANTGESAGVYWEEVVRLYRGDLLEEEMYQDWAALPREVLRETYIEALFHLATYYQGAGRYDRAIGFWRKFQAKDPLREEAHRGLMYCYAREGQRGAALHQYSLLVALLARELGVEPEPETKALYRRLVGGDPL